MSYPNTPSNRLIVNSVDLTDEFGLVLADGYTLGPPSVKTYTVDIPGGNGVLDLTESLLGDTAYGDRTQEFTFYVINTDNFEQIKTNVKNFLHGRSYSYQMTMDPGYTYFGRFTVSSYEHYNHSDGKVGMIKMEVKAKPFKYLPDNVYQIYALGGSIFHFEGGRKRVRPIIETDTFVKVIFNNKLTMLQEGSWTINDILFTHGSNEIYFNSRDIKNLTWADLKTNNITYGSFKEHRLFEWYKTDGQGNFILSPWSNLSSNTWDSLSDKKWAQLPYIFNGAVDESNIYIKYEVGDL